MTSDANCALVTASELSELVSSSNPPVVLDVRWQVGAPSQHAAYRSGHIPGAHWCDLDADLADAPGASGRHPLPDPDRLQQRLRAWGIDNDSAVVVYDGSDSIGAARAWWVLRWAGISGVRVLNGGFSAWVESDLPIETKETDIGSGTAVVRADSLPTLDAELAADFAAQGRLIDVRVPERFRGEIEPMDPVAGRIPGAFNIPASGNLSSSGAFKPASVLRQQFAAHRVGADEQPVGVYCGSGVTAAQTVLSLNIAGIDAVLYPGSWSQWITDPSRPVETG
jgi:thiosulfate/3-mercaptopyruvate sulfurtransferase